MGKFRNCRVECPAFRAGRRPAVQPLHRLRNFSALTVQIDTERVDCSLGAEAPQSPDPRASLENIDDLRLGDCPNESAFWTPGFGATSGGGGGGRIDSIGPQTQRLEVVLCRRVFGRTADFVRQARGQLPLSNSFK